MHLSLILSLVLGVHEALAINDDGHQQPLQLELEQTQTQTPFIDPLRAIPRPLNGRFLHVTDMHPDELYIPNTDVNTGCHYPKPKPRKKDRAGHWGSSKTDCDSPFGLLNLTLEWLEEEWADKVDFVIWTGDNARHDNDNGHPRTPAEIYELNRIVAGRMEDIFTSRGVPVIPSLGNNDVWPHNIMYPGPSSITNEYSSIWKPFIPFASYQVFQRGAYYSIDIVPDELGALSLNTMYWYDSNKAVDGCTKGEPGYLELDWMEVQLDRFRERGMQVWLSGHVPPSPGNYFPDCYRRYGELVIRFQDTIVGQLFGHMNVDHFFWIDTEDLRVPSVRFKDKSTLANDLLVDFRGIPTKKAIDLDDYSIINVAPSVVPTYFPSLRVFTYNSTGGNEGDDVFTQGKRHHGHRHRQHDIDCRLRKNRKKKDCRFKKPRHSDPLAPSRTNTLWTPLGYSQFYIPNLDQANATSPPRYELEYLTYDLSVMNATAEYPVPHPLLPRELVNTTKHKRLAPYELEDLTIGSWVSLARKLGKGKKKKLWKKFVGFMYQDI